MGYPSTAPVFFALWVLQVTRLGLIILSFFFANSDEGWIEDSLMMAFEVLMLTCATIVQVSDWSHSFPMYILFFLFWCDTSKVYQAMWWSIDYMDGIVPQTLIKTPPYRWDAGYTHFRNHMNLWLSLNLGARVIILVLVRIAMWGYARIYRYSRQLTADRLAVRYV